MYIYIFSSLYSKTRVQRERNIIKKQYIQEFAKLLSSAQMSMSADFREFGKLKAPEKTSFSQTCNLLSQYLKKEKRGFGDLTFAPTLYRDSEKSPAMDLFPQHVGFGDEEVKMPTAPSENGRKAMTIIYGGKVIVFDEITEKRVKEVMMLATSSSLKNNSSFCSNLDLSAPHVSGLPIARKASLHRFLEKRKDRIIARAPYQLNMSIGSASKPEEKKTCLEFF